MVRPGEIVLRDVSRRFRITHERNQTLKQVLVHRKRTRATDLWVLRGVSLHMEPGSSVGVVGRNGTGKSTMLKLVAGILPPQAGDIEVGGTVAPLLELGAGFHPEFTGRENVYMQGALYGLGDREVDERFDAIVAFAELEGFIDMPVKTYSSGMFMRLAFAIAAHVEPDILLLDEVLAVGDAAFQQKCMGRIFEHRRRGGTVLFVSHNQEDVERVCTRAILLDEGLVVADGTPADVFAEYGRLLVARGGEPLKGRPAEPPHDDSSGTGRVTITRFSAVANGQATRRVLEGDALTICFEISAREPITGAIYGVEFHDLSGALLYGVNTRMADLVTGTVSGHHTVELSIDHLPLRAGRVVLTLHAVSADETEVFHRLRACAHLDVFPQSVGVGPVSFGHPSWVVDGVHLPASVSAS